MPQWGYCEIPLAATLWSLFGYTEGEFNTANASNQQVIQTVAENPQRHGENMQTPHRQSPKPGIEPRSLVLWGNSANHCATVLPHGEDMMIGECVGIGAEDRDLHTPKFSMG